MGHYMTEQERAEHSTVTDELRAFREAAWEYEPEPNDDGLDRWSWLSALLAEVREWTRSGGPVPMEDHPDPSAFSECLSHCQLIRDKLREATEARRKAESR